MRAGWPGWAPAGAAFGLGAVLATGQAPLGFWWLALPALAALIALICRAAGGRSAAWLGLFAGIGYFGLAMSWLISPFLVDPERHAWMAPFALFFMAAGLSLFWAGAAALSFRAAPGWRPLALAVTLAVAELARGFVLTGLPWALIGHVWIGTWPGQVAALLGPDGLTLMTTLAAALPVALGLRGLVASALLLAAAAAFGHSRLSAPDPAPADVTLRLVQPNAAQEAKWDPDRALEHFRRLLDLTSAPPATGPRPDLVIWPETAVPFLLDLNPEIPGLVAEAGQGAQVAFGFQRVEGLRAWNSLAVIDPQGQIAAVYDKHHLVPFGEYIPFGDLAHDLFGLSAFAARQGQGYSAGPGPRLLDFGAPLGRALPLICYEAVFPRDVAAAPDRPDWLLQVTNDAWFGTLTGPYQHLAQARLRAVEQGLPLVRVANTGVSALIDARGRLLAQIPLGQMGALDVTLPGALPPTPFARWGEAPVLLLLAGLAALALWPRRRSAA
jgi:apolipoprotein N-acyltransferase